MSASFLSVAQTTMPIGRDTFLKEICSDAETLDRLDAYASLLNRWQKRINLVSSQSLAGLWGRHFLDSAQLFRYLPGSAKNLTDIGSGAGFPGLILAILATQHGGPVVSLIEGDSRKAAFLREASRICEANVRVLNVRVEKSDLNPADVVTARACAPLNRLLPLVHQCMSRDGAALLLKGAKWKDELTAARKKWTMEASEFSSLTDASGVVLKLRGLAPN